MTTCDWRGPICMTNKDADRIAGWSLRSTVFPATEFLLPAESRVEVFPEGIFLNGRLLEGHETLVPTIEPGDEIVVRRGCSKRQGHRGDHGTYRWKRWTRRWRRG